MLRAPEAPLAPTDEVRAVDIETKYQKLIERPGHPDLEAWSYEFEHVYTNAERYKIHTMIESASRDFIHIAVQKIRRSGDNYARELYKGEELPGMHDLINDFRQLVLLHKARNINYLF